MRDGRRGGRAEREGEKRVAMLRAREGGAARRDRVLLLLWSVPPGRTQRWSRVVSGLFLGLYLYMYIGEGALGPHGT